MNGNYINKNIQNKSMDLKFPLQEFGLSDKEAQVYLELLPLGSVSLQEISKRLNYPRSTIYHTLNYLIKKGLVGKIIKEKITYYTATEPEKLKEQLFEKQKLIDSILPNLTALKSTIKNPSNVEVYEGFKGVHTILTDLCMIVQPVCYFGGYKKSLEKLKHLPNFTRNLRVEKKIHARVLIDPIDEPVLHTKKYQEVSELRFLKSLEEFPCMIFIYGEKVSMFSFKTDLVGIIITNKDFANAMQMIFDLYWSMGKVAFPKK